MGALSSVRKRVSKFLDDVTPLSKAEAAARDEKRARHAAKPPPKPGTKAAQVARSAAKYGPDTKEANLRQAVKMYMPKKKK